MARVEIPIVVLNSTTGLPVVGAAVAVTVRATGNPATWYTAETGGTGSTAAIVTDAAGRVSAWVPRGAYNLAVSGTGITGYTEPWDAVPGADGTIDNLWIGSGVATNILGTAVLAPYSLSGANSTIGSVTATHNGRGGRVLFVAHAVLDIPTFNMSLKLDGAAVFTSPGNIGTEGGLVCCAYTYTPLSGSHTWSVSANAAGGAHSEGDGLLVVVEQ